MARLVVGMACSVPTLALAIRGWTTAILVLCAILSLLLPWNGAWSGAARAERRLIALVAGSLCLPFLVTACTGAIRGDLRWDHLDAPFRFLLACPVFLFFCRPRGALGKLRWTLPLAVAGTLAYVLVVGQPARWPANRMATAVADPLVFGYVCLALCLMCIMAIGAQDDWRTSPLPWLLLIAAVIGAVFSIRSGSRTGWLAMPLVLGYWTYDRFRSRTRWTLALPVVIPLAVLVLLYVLVPTVQLRVEAGLVELRRYSWDGVTKDDTSVGMRITMARMAVELLLQQPLAGLGDTSRVPAASLPAFSYAAADAVSAAFRSGFHNQILSNAVRMGVPGLLSAAALLLVPLAVCLRGLHLHDPEGRRVARIGFAFFATIAISSLTTEVVDLKFMASFYAVLVAVLAGSVIASSRPAETAAP